MINSDAVMRHGYVTFPKHSPAVSGGWLPGTEWYGAVYRIVGSLHWQALGFQYLVHIFDQRVSCKRFFDQVYTITDSSITGNNICCIT